MAKNNKSANNIQFLIEMSEEIVADHGRPRNMEVVEFLDNEYRYCSINGVQCHIDDIVGEVSATNGVFLYEGGEYVFGVFELHEVDRGNVQDALSPKEEQSGGGFWKSLAKKMFTEKKYSRDDNGNNVGSRFNTEDQITKTYGFKIFTPKYEAIKKMITKMQNVSSHSATSRRIDFYVHGSFPMKGVSIYLSYMTLESHLEPLKVLPPWLKTAISLLLAVFVEFMFGYESGAIFNRTAQWMTRATGTILSIAIFTTAVTFHLAYVEKETAEAQKGNTKEVTTTRNSSPELAKLYAELDIINESIREENASLASINKGIANTIKSLEAQRDVFLAKAKKYQEIVDRVDNRKRSDSGCVRKKTRTLYGRVNGGCKPVATIVNYANAQNKKASAITAKIAKLQPKSSPRLQALKIEKVNKLDAIKKEQERVIEEKNDVSSDSLSVIRVILIVVEIMSKMDLYGFFLARWNLRGNVIDYFEPVIDVASTTAQMTGIIAQLSHQNALVMKNQSDTLATTNEAIEGVNHSVLIGASQTISSHKRLLKELVGQINRNNRSNRANYVPIGDQKHDVSADRVKRTSAEIAEWESLLTEYVQAQGFDFEVMLTPHVKIGAVENGIIKIEDSLLDEDLKKAVDHELTHIVTGSTKHDEKFKETLKEVSKKDEPKKPVHINKKTPFFTEDRKMEILRMFFAKGTDYSEKEKELFRQYQIWDELNGCINNQTLNHETFYEALQHEY